MKKQFLFLPAMALALAFTFASADNHSTDQDASQFLMGDNVAMAAAIGGGSSGDCEPKALKLCWTRTENFVGKYWVEDASPEGPEDPATPGDN